jgi:hypothetical protein
VCDVDQLLSSSWLNIKKTYLTREATVICYHSVINRGLPAVVSLPYGCFKDT